MISFSGEQIESKDVAVALGLASAEMLVKTAKAIAENKPAEVLKVVDDLIGRGQDLRNFSRDLLSFFRDLLVFKMAGDAENLLDTAVLNHDELRENSAPFSESDLIRFFNSLSETESKLREAAQPRYVLEIGLVKLVEMRRVAPIEKILERLAKLETALSGGTLQSENSTQKESGATRPEKKTLTVDFPLEEAPFPVSPATISSVEEIVIAKPIVEIAEEKSPRRAEAPVFDEPPMPFSSQPETVFQPNPTFAETAAKIIEAMPIKMPPITSEELEHIEDTWLDDDYERKLQALGDDLAPIKNAAEIVEILLGENRTNTFAARIETGNGGAATAFAPAKDKPIFVIPNFDEEESSAEIPVLPENPTEAEIWTYAENHPLVKKALRVFRGKIVEVKRETKGESG